MKSKNSFLIVIVLLLVLASPAAAVPPERTAHTLNTSGVERTLILPAEADNSPVIYLGEGIDPQTGKRVEGVAFVHYKKGYDHKPNHGRGGGNNGGNTGSSCYAYLSNGAKWRTVEPWIVNSDNIRGLDGDYIFNNLGGDIAKWETAASGADILGVGTTTDSVLVADQSAPDGLNEVYFADVSSSGAIAVTIVWGIFSGPPFARELVEWDMVFDDVDFDWSQNGEAGKMDFENIATHEIGHAMGMGHPDDSCVDETMYRFADFGETKKRDLNAGDIAGIDNLY